MSEAAALGRGRPEGPDASFSRILTDSRGDVAGALFVALKGERVDGHTYVADVLSRGAAGAIVSRVPGGMPSGASLIVADDAESFLQRWGAAARDRFSGRVVGITGSNGKTTTKEMLSSILRAAGRRSLTTRGNFNSRIGLPIMLTELSAAHTDAVLELGASQKGDIARLAAWARPHVGVITGIGAAHLETFGSIEGVAEGKWELAASLPADGCAVLNADDERLMSRAGRAPCRVVSFGFSSLADVRAEALTDGESPSFDWIEKGSRVSVRLQAAGAHNVRNALAAAAAARCLGVSREAVVRGLEEFRPSGHRSEIRKVKGGRVIVLDAYNANPTSMAASLESFSRIYAGRPRWIVIGSMLELGASSRSAHEDIGRLIAERRFDRAYFVGPEAEWVRAFAPQVAAAADKAALCQELAGALPEGAAVLFKASRSVRLEDVFEPLLAHFAD